MSYVESNLSAGERVIHQGELHWAIYLPGIILLPFFGIGVIFLILAYVKKISTEMAVTNKRIIIKDGFISRRTIEMNLAKIENIGIDQGIFGRMLDYGTVTVVGTGGTREQFKCVAIPLAFRRAVQAQTMA